MTATRNIILRSVGIDDSKSVGLVIAVEKRFVGDLEDWSAVTCNGRSAYLIDVSGRVKTYSNSLSIVNVGVKIEELD